MPRVAARHNTGGSMPHNRPPRMGGGFHSHGPRYRGRHYYSSSSSSRGNPVVCCCITIPICVIAFTIAGFALIFASNNRVENIKLYNTYAEEWEKSFKSSFQGASFYVNSVATQMTKVSGKYFPVFDSCVKDSGDGACIASESVFHYSSLSLTGKDSVSVRITDDKDQLLWEESGVTGYYLIYSRSEMSCDPYADDSESNSCYRKCINRGGEYNDFTQECKVAYSLVRICLRVDGENNSYQLDTAHAYRFSASGNGCYFSGKYKPFVYARQYQIPNSISVEVRHYADPVISASELTSGCSDKYAYSASSHSCFGMKKSTQIVLGVCFLTVAVIMIVLLVGCAIGGAKCIKGMTNKQNSTTVPLTGAIPTAQPVPAGQAGQAAQSAQSAQSVQMPYPMDTPIYTHSQIPTAQPVQPMQPMQPQMYYAPSTYNNGL